MNLRTAVQKTIEDFEKKSCYQEIVKLDAINNLFEEMVSKGLISRPTYNLEPISTITTSFNHIK